jgi:Holliday junction resolvase RusA-like endonuclease
VKRKKDPTGFLLCGKKPDNDNLEKAVYDCITDAGLWTDFRLRNKFRYKFRFNIV